MVVVVVTKILLRSNPDQIRVDLAAEGQMRGSALLVQQGKGMQEEMEAPTQRHSALVAAAVLAVLE